MDNAAIIIATISAVTTLAGGGIVAWQQLRKDKGQMSVDMERLKEEAERELWGRVNAQLVDMRQRLDAQDQTIAEQGVVIMQLRGRVTMLEQENARLRDENERLRGGK
jgi:hypothetical protein